MLRSRSARPIPRATRPPPDDHASMSDLGRTKIVSRMRASCRAARVRPGTMRKFFLDFISATVQPELTETPTQSVRAFRSKLNWWDPFKRSTPFAPAPVGPMELTWEDTLAWEDTMVIATVNRAMAAEHHRLACTCRSPESREQHSCLETGIWAALAEERGPRDASDPQIVK